MSKKGQVSSPKCVIEPRGLLRGDTFALVRKTAAVLIFVLLISYFIVAFGIAQVKALGPRGHTSQ
jgi:hypothetical protein